MACGTRVAASCIACAALAAAAGKQKHPTEQTGRLMTSDDLMKQVIASVKDEDAND